MKILVVEDDENSRILQQTILEGSGFEVVAAGNGKEALVAIQQAVPDLIISDIMMPEMDGYALCRAIKSDPALAGIPFIVYSATYTSDTDRQLALELGATRYLIKPLDPDELLKQILETLAQGVPPDAGLPPPPIDREAVDAKYERVIAQKLDKKMTELKNTRSQLETSETRLRRIQESYRIAQQLAQVGCWDWDLPKDEMWWSDELFKLLGIDPTGTTPDRALLLSRIAPEDRERFARALALAAEKGVAFKLDHGILGAGEARRLAHTEAEILAADSQTGQPIRLICALRDITRQWQMEEDKARLEASLRQAQKMEALGALASGIAHDFNNVLTGILGSAELLRLRLPNLEQEDREYLDQVVSASRRATELVRQILTFSRRGEQAKCPTDLAAVVNEALKFLRVAIPSTIAIQTELAPACPPVLADPTQIYQVIMNLCVNAHHAMRPNGGTLGISLQTIRVEGWDKVARAGLKAGRYVFLSVSDTGCGMDSSTMERIFEPYFTTKKPDEGTGLGLSVVHGIILGHNGHITVSSERERGTIFSIYLPALTRPAEIKAVPSETLHRGNSENILLVDDEHLMTTVISNMLEELNYHVTMANSSSEAWGLFQKDPAGFDLVVTDLTMPEMDGLTLAQKINKLRPGLPLILCTGFSEVMEERTASETGIRAVLTKPFMIKDLATAIYTALQAPPNKKA